MTKGLSVLELEDLENNELKDLENSELMQSMPVESRSSNQDEPNELIDENGYTEMKIMIKKKQMTRSIFTVDEEDEYN